MLLLSVSLLLTLQAWSTPIEKKLKKHFQTYVLQVSRGNVAPNLYTDDFKPILKGDKLIYQVCAKQSCFIRMSLKPLKHKSNLWKLKAQVSYGPPKNRKKLKMRQGCYFIHNNKLSNYIEDCDDR